jgi:hypothetical protein
MILFREVEIMKRKLVLTVVSVIMITFISGFVMGAPGISAGVRMTEGSNKDTGTDKDTISNKTGSAFGETDTGSCKESETSFTGTWYLAYDMDYNEMNAAFPDVYAFGDELVIRPDGRIYWHVGAAGAAGTYEVYGNQIAASISDIMEDDEYRIALTADDEGRLYMKYKSVPLEWEFYSEGY